MKNLLFVTFTFIILSLNAQVKIGNNLTNPVANSSFQVEGDTTNDQLVVLKNGQVAIGTIVPEPNALLDVTSTSKGFLPPRLTTTERTLIVLPAKGLMIYNLTENCLQVNNGTPSSPIWNCISGFGTITTLSCGSSTANGILVSGTAASGVSSVISYTGSNGGKHNGQTVNSTGVTGLTATVASGIFALGSGTLTYNISGTPTSGGIASFAINIGRQSCMLNRTVITTSITTLNCSTPTNNGTLTQNVAASGVSSVISYTGGNGTAHSGQTVSSTGVTGLTATLAAGSFANGSGTLTYSITGTPTSSGTASFAIDIGGQSCTLTREVTAIIISTLNCSTPTNNGTLNQNVVASGVSSVISYTGGNGSAHSGQTVSSTGVTGLTATLAAGTFANGSGTLTYTITGTPTTTGTASFAINIGGKSCVLQRTVQASGTITTLKCTSVIKYGTLFEGFSASGVSFKIPYTGGNGGSYPSQTVNSTGVTGVMASLTAGTLAVGNGNITFLVTGTPNTSGTASFSITFCGITCLIVLNVSAAILDNSTCYGQYISKTSCANVVGATLNDVTSTPLGIEYNWSNATSTTMGVGFGASTNTRAIVDIGGQCWAKFNMNIYNSYGAVNQSGAGPENADCKYYSGGPYPNEGYLYQWNAAMDLSIDERAQGICPNSWHVPSDCEWMYLENTLGMSVTDQEIFGLRDTGDVGSQLSTLTNSPTNSSGFSALLAGEISLDSFGNYSLRRGERATFWSSTITYYNPPYNTANSRWVMNIWKGVLRSTYSGFISVRCLKD